MGTKLMHKLALKTSHLNPKHTYVPWITINGKHTQQLQDEAWKDIIGLICKIYHGDSKPKECLKSPKFQMFQFLP